MFRNTGPGCPVAAVHRGTTVSAASTNTRPIRIRVGVEVGSEHLGDLVPSLPSTGTPVSRPTPLNSSHENRRIKIKPPFFFDTAFFKFIQRARQFKVTSTRQLPGVLLSVWPLFLSHSAQSSSAKQSCPSASRLSRVDSSPRARSDSPRRISPSSLRVLECISVSRFV